MFEKINYKNLTPLAIGQIGEYWTKLVLTLNGLDVYTSEVDDKGIDFVVRNQKGQYFDIQVKTVRLASTFYVFMTKKGEWRELRDNLYLALVLITDKEIPKIFLIPSTAWLIESDILKDREYGGEKKSHPEWGINISNKNLDKLEVFNIEQQVNKLKSD